MSDETFRDETDLPGSEDLGDIRLDELTGPVTGQGDSLSAGRA